MNFISRLYERGRRPRDGRPTGRRGALGEPTGVDALGGPDHENALD